MTVHDEQAVQLIAEAISGRRRHPWRPGVRVQSNNPEYRFDAENIVQVLRNEGLTIQGTPSGLDSAAREQLEDECATLETLVADGEITIAEALRRARSIGAQLSTRHRVGDLIKTSAELIELPVGTEFESTHECLWPERYGGVQWRVTGSCRIQRLTADGLGREPGKSTSAMAHFSDPLPARITKLPVRGQE